MPTHTSRPEQGTEYHCPPMPAPHVSFHVLVPGLLAPLRRRRAAGVPVPEAPGLAALVARSRVRTGRPEPVERAAARLAGLACKTDPPVGAVRRLGLGAVPDDVSWMAATPVHIRPDLNGAVLFEGPELAITDAEARALCEAFDAHWSAEGLHLEPTVPAHWHLRLPRGEPPQTTPLEQVRGGDPFPALPGGPRKSFWWRVLNETQMLFHQHPVNRGREAHGRPTLNALWLWGAGRLPVSTPRPVRVLSHDPFLLGLARLHPGGRAAPLPEDPARWIGGATEQAWWIHLDALDRPSAYDDPPAWEAALQQLDQAWFVPLASALRRGRLPGLVLLDPPGGLRLEARPGRWRGWWGNARWAARLLEGADR